MTTKEQRRAVMLAEVRARRAGQAAPSEPAGAWAACGACNGHASLFDDPKHTAEALAICATCPVLDECYRWALHNAVDGVAGGMTADARISKIVVTTRSSMKVKPLLVFGDDVSISLTARLRSLD